MLKGTPHLWILMAIVLVFGPWIPVLGYIVPIVFLAAFISGLSRGRWMCGNICPRGSFNDFILSKISRMRKIPAAFHSMWVRVPVLLLMMVFMLFRLSSTQGIVNQVGMVFVSMCYLTTIIAVLLGITVNPRAWCSFCPMGTLQNILGQGKPKVSVDPALCIDCGRCSRICPIQIEPNRTGIKPDCLLCGRCVRECRHKALLYGKGQ
ncbi:4Fe-4S binding protein [Candidatus Altiarchaeota archaeon]